MHDDFYFIESQEESETDGRDDTTHRLPFSPKPRLPVPTLAHSPARRSLTPIRNLGNSPIKQTPKSKLRHENSQILFTAIESSPVAEADQDSQLLTERQKEVKEAQQRLTASLFPTIRSSPTPRPSSRRTNAADNIVSSIMLSSEADDERPTTPTLPAPHGPMDEFLGSSPTPASVPRRKTPRRSREASTPRPQLAGLREVEEPPSSPPQVECGEVVVVSSVGSEEATGEELYET